VFLDQGRDVHWRCLILIWTLRVWACYLLPPGAQLRHSTRDLVGRRRIEGFCKSLPVTVDGSGFEELQLHVYQFTTTNEKTAPFACLNSIAKSAWFFRHHSFFAAVEDLASPKGSAAATLSLTRVQPVKGALQMFKLLSCLAQLAFRCQALVVGKVLGCLDNKRVQIRCGLG
jgi:hypothetical protein